MDAVSIEMHIDRTHEVAMSAKPAATARPSSALGLVFVPAARTPARCASFGAGRARDAGLFRFVRKVVDVTAVFPLRHAAIVVTATITGAHAMRVADEERPDFLLATEVDDLAGGLMPQVADAPFGSPAYLVLRPLEFLPASGVCLATALLFGKPPELFAALSLDGANATSGHDQGSSRSSGDGREVDFPEVNARLSSAGSLTCLLNLDADVQFKAIVPDERARPGTRRKREGQDQRRSPLAHRQDRTSFLLADRLGGPVDGVEALRAPGVLHAHLGMLLAQFAGSCDGRHKHSHDSLNRLAMQRKVPLHHLTESVFVRPWQVGEARLLVGLHTLVPHAGRLHLCRFEPLKARRRQMGQSVHTNYLHTLLFFLSARHTVICRVAATRAGSLSSRPVPGGGASRSQC